ncbi:MAG: ABC transporter permease [Nocardioidaceae bacterium]
MVRDRVGLYAALAAQGFRRYATYRAATWAGIFTNSVFGVILAYTYIALWSQRPHLGGYGVAEALTYVWVAQGLIMPTGLFGAVMVQDAAQRVRTGAVAIDLYRPTRLLGWRLAEDLGRAAYHLLTRGLMPAVVGLLLFHLAIPERGITYVWFAVSMVLAVVVGFGLRYLVGLIAFWVIDIQGYVTLLFASSMFFSGMVLPLVVFPGWLGTAADLLPFRCLIQIPNDVLLSDHTGTAIAPLLGVQLVWSAVLLLSGRLVTDLAVRKVVVQGG